LLLNARFEIFISEMMETNISVLEEHIFKELVAEDTNHSG
jgi:hypothetical protein